MKEQIWLLADAATGDVSYVDHGQDGDQEHWKTIGPFAYTSQAAAAQAAANPRFLPDGVTTIFSVVDVETSGFIQAIFNGFPPMNTDVFALDEHLYPLTNGGADWVDEALGQPIWGPMFNEDEDHSGLGWLDRVLKQAAKQLDMNMETVQAIGAVNAAAEDEAAEVEQSRLLVQEHVRVAITPEPDTLAVDTTDQHHTLTPAARFWMHTIGLAQFGLPELEIRGIPAWWITAAGAELNGWAAYSLDQGIAEDEELDGGGPVPLKIRAVTSPDPIWQEKDTECLRLEVAKVLFAYGHQKHSSAGPKAVH
jgi:hypothetical protein